MGIQAFLAELSVKGRIGGLPSSDKAWYHAPMIDAQAQTSRDKYRPIARTSSFWVANFTANPIKGLGHVLTPKAEFYIQNGHIVRERINDCQNT